MAFAKCQDLIDTTECSVHFLHRYPEMQTGKRGEHCVDQGLILHTEFILKISASHANL